MRLDWFLPVIRRPHASRAEPKRYWIVRTARRLLPASFSSNWTTKQRGLVRIALRKLGLSWLASPVRRAVQTTSFVVFLLLFFYVCWPYDAVPTRQWPGFVPVGVDPATGIASITHPSMPDARSLDQEVVYVSDASEGPEALSSFGAFEVARTSDEAIELRPTATMTEELRVTMALSPGPWILSDRVLQAWPDHYAENLASKERIAAESFLIIDPLVSLSTAVASRASVWSLVSAGAILLVCVLIPRGFCGYLCPLGTLIDLFDTLVGRRVTRFRVADDGWWVHTKYYLLLGIMVAAMCGVLVSGVFAAIPVITRGLLFTLAPLQTGWANGWHQMPPMGLGHFVSIALFAAVLGLGFLKPRFWCKYVCPSGAVFSLGNLFRVSERKVESSCIHCNKCVEICPFDAIKADFTTRGTDCTLCQSCAGVCPTQAIKFVGRWEIAGLKAPDDPATHETWMGRRSFVASSIGVLTASTAGAAAAAAARWTGARLDQPDAFRPVRPPGSVVEEEFLQKCIRCAECFKACPSDVLQPLGFQQGFEGLWTPHVVADWAGCASSCNACGQVCPTGAIVAMPLEQKRQVRMGLAIVDDTTCLPLAGREACQLCVDECHHAGYHAIEFMQVGTQVDAEGLPIEGSGFLAPVVLPDLCVGCGLCQTRCYGINVASKELLQKSAIVIQSGEGREDRTAASAVRS